MPKPESRTLQSLANTETMPRKRQAALKFPAFPSTGNGFSTYSNTTLPPAIPRYRPEIAVPPPTDGSTTHPPSKDLLARAVRGVARRVHPTKRRRTSGSGPKRVAPKVAPSGVNRSVTIGNAIVTRSGRKVGEAGGSGVATKDKAGRREREVVDGKESGSDGGRDSGEDSESGDDPDRSSDEDFM